MEQIIKKDNIEKITIIGKTNTGKSTLLNTILNKSICIVSKKKNTTIEPLNIQFNKKNLTDTPGIIININYKIKNNNKKIYNEIADSKIILLNIDITNINSEDFFLLELTKKYKSIIILNKIDKIKNKENILPITKKISKKFNNINIIPFSNLSNINLNSLKTKLKIDDGKKIKVEYKNENNLIKNTIREIFLNNFDKEIPYNIQINAEKKINNNLSIIEIEIKTNKKNYKKIIIGKNSQKIIYIKKKIKCKIKKFIKNVKHININIKYDNKYRHRYS